MEGGNCDGRTKRGTVGCGFCVEGAVGDDIIGVGEDWFGDSDLSCSAVFAGAVFSMLRLESRRRLRYRGSIAVDSFSSSFSFVASR